MSDAPSPTDPPPEAAAPEPGRGNPLTASGDEPVGTTESTAGVSRLRVKAPWIALAAFCLLFDLVTKWWVFYPHATQPDFREGKLVGSVCTGWDTILVYNNGITFGLFPSAGPWILAGLTGVVIAVLCGMLWTAPPGQKLRQFALSIVIGGAIGNLYDRTVRPILETDTNPGVRDFLDWYVPRDTATGQWLIENFGTNHWYTSNVADVIIVCGVILLAWCILREPEAKADGSADGSESDHPHNESAAEHASA